MKKLIFILLNLIFTITLQAQKVTETTARITYYNLIGKTASGIRTHGGICAVSRDLEKLGFKLGEKVYIDGYGVFQILDRTSSKLKRTVDIWLPKNKKIKNGKNVRIRLVYDNN